MNAPASPETPAPDGKRRRALGAVAGLVLLAGLAYGAYWALVLNHYESTDNAYVQGHVVQVTPQAGGTVVAVAAEDTQAVRAGQWLVRFDPADARIALAQAEAQLAQTVRETRQLYAGQAALQAQAAARAAELARARSELQRAQDDAARRAPLVASGAVGREEYEHAAATLATLRSGVAAAEQALVAAREQLAASRALTEGVALAEHPAVQRAAARVREAALALRRTELVAPIDGVVARRNVQLGQRVAAGTPLMSVIALGDLWVEANFKEGQLRDLRPGQPVELKADVYGGGMVYHGTVEGLGAGTGAAFALLPAQNATGNWIKVVQRVPVRIRLDPAELAKAPLRVGLSMVAKVDVSRTEGPSLAEAAARPARTAVFDADAAAADAELQRVLAANGLRAAGPK